MLAQQLLQTSIDSATTKAKKVAAAAILMAALARPAVRNVTPSQSSNAVPELASLDQSPAESKVDTPAENKKESENLFGAFIKTLAKESFKKALGIESKEKIDKKEKEDKKENQDIFEKMFEELKGIRTVFSENRSVGAIQGGGGTATRVDDMNPNQVLVDQVQMIIRNDDKNTQKLIEKLDELAQVSSNGGFNLFPPKVGLPSPLPKTTPKRIPSAAGSMTSMLSRIGPLAVPGAIIGAGMIAANIEQEKRANIMQGETSVETKDVPLARAYRENITEQEARGRNVRDAVKQISPQYAKELLASDLSDTEIKQEIGVNRDQLKKGLEGYERYAKLPTSERVKYNKEKGIPKGVLDFVPSIVEPTLSSPTATPSISTPEAGAGRGFINPPNAVPSEELQTLSKQEREMETNQAPVIINNVTNNTATPQAQPSGSTSVAIVSNVRNNNSTVEQVMLKAAFATLA